MSSGSKVAGHVERFPDAPKQTVMNGCFRRYQPLPALFHATIRCNARTERARCSGLDIRAHHPRSAEGAALVHHEKERRRAIRSSRQVRCPAGAMAAGIDAASMARRCQDNIQEWSVFSPSAEMVARRGGRGLVSQAVAPRLGHRWRGIRRCRTRPSLICRGLKSTEHPPKSRPSRPDFRWPHAGETSPRPPRRSRNQRPA